jgi:hypothetical protein
MTHWSRTSIQLILGLGLFAAPPPDGPTPEYLYLLSGTAANGANLPVALYRVPAQEAGEAELVRKIADGMECVLSDYERRRLIVASPAIAPTDFQVIDMDAPSRAVTIQIPYRSEEQLPAGVYLLDLPKQGVTLGLQLGQNWKKDDPIPEHLVGVPLGSPDSKPLDLPMDDLGNVRTSGLVGGALPLLSQNWIWMRGDPLKVLPGDGTGRSTGIPRPPYIKDAGIYDSYLLVANNDSVSVLQKEPGTLDVFDKKTKEWRRGTIPFLRSRVRAFGPWLAAIKTDLAAPLPTSSQVVATPQTRASRKTSPGSAKRQTEELDGKTTVDDLFQQGMDVFPGELLIYNALSGATFQISTGEGDSEILLITDSAVYYRVNDELFRAELNGGGLGKPLAIASGDEVVQAHWAFLSSDGPESGH